MLVLAGSVELNIDEVAKPDEVPPPLPLPLLPNEPVFTENGDVNPSSGHASLSFIMSMTRGRWYRSGRRRSTREREMRERCEQQRANERMNEGTWLTRPINRSNDWLMAGWLAEEIR